VILQTSNALTYLLHSEMGSKGDVGRQKSDIKQELLDNTFTETALHIS
jgi:hypothetical protein